MYTRCPQCSTCFRVTERHLAIAKGKVRCGRCQHVFNATEHAIDDLPTSSTGTQANNKIAPAFTPAVKTEAEKPVSPVQETQSTRPSPVAEAEKIESTTKPAEQKIIQEAEVKPSIADTAKIETQVVEESITETTKPDTPAFNADATMVADIDAINKEELSDIDLDAPSEKQKHHDGFNPEDDVFDDSFDLNAAIDELTHEAEDESVIDKEITTSSEQTPPEENNQHDVFTTDAYDATNASSVADIMNEMEGQLSLNIPEPKDDKEYDVNDEFEFIELDNQTDDSNIEEETNDQTLARLFDIDEMEDINTETESDLEHAEDEFSFIESENDLEDFVTENEDVKEEQINEDELFNHVDLSDFQDSEVQEDAVLEKAKQTSDDIDIPFQLRNDLNHLQAPAQRRFHPLLSLFFIIILLVLSFSQLAYFRAYELVRLIPSSRPLLEQFCEKVHCHYSGPVDTKQIQLISRDVRLHPKEKKALLISAAMINNAHFAQPYPNIYIRLSDISGNVVAERTFTAKTYLGKLSNPFLLMKSKTPVHINFEVVDPGKDAVNFEFTFL